MSGRRPAAPAGRGPKAPGRLEAAIRRHALSYPEAREEFPWGDRAVKVRGKAFLFSSLGREPFTFSVKLPASGRMALMLPFAAPTGYGLGRSGWITLTLAAGTKAPMELLQGWIEESYRAVAPRKLSARLDTEAPGSPKP